MDFSRLKQLLTNIGEGNVKCSLVINLNTHRTKVLIDMNECFEIHTNWNKMCDLLDYACHIMVNNKEYLRNREEVWEDVDTKDTYSDSSILALSNKITIIY